MLINFKEELPDGRVEFSGELKKEEVDFLLRYALLHLLSRGLLPNSVMAQFDDDDEEGGPSPEKLN